LNQFADLKIMNTQLRGENKKLKVLLQVATKEIQKQRKGFVSDLKGFQEVELGVKVYHMFEECKKKWEGKSC
ncbi:unnamed protein product, partial [marine sediment metagenome]